MKILIWGTGQLCSRVVRYIGDDRIFGYIDSFREGTEFAGKPLYRPSEIKKTTYDAVVVATLHTRDVIKTCCDHSIDLDRVIFVYSNLEINDINKDYEFVARVIGEKYANVVKNRYHLIREIEVDINTPLKKFDFAFASGEKELYESDYIRGKTLELLADEIYRNNITGDVAELGVFRGDFSKYINMAFMDRTLYLFDTFEGFDSEEVNAEWAGRSGVQAEIDAFKNTSIDIVMDKMKHLENVAIKKGFFPDSLNGLDTKFAFVSIDCDYEESIYQGLVYFYPRLEVGGYIMLHDYNNFLTCAKSALKRYANDYGVSVPKVPICDAQGSVVLTR